MGTLKKQKAKKTTAAQKPAKKAVTKKTSAPKTALTRSASATKAPASKPAVATAAPMKPAAKVMPQAPAPQANLPRTPVTTSARPSNPLAGRMMQSKPVMHRPGGMPMPAKPSLPIVNPAMADNDNVDFIKGDYVVYPAHGVGQIEGVETQTIGGMQIRLYAVSFEKERMRLKIPVFKAKASGLRKLCSSRRLKDAIETLQGRARVRRTMWSRRAQEYEMKINSGDPVAIAEVLRDLKRSNDDSEQSYSERQIYQSALERLAREFAAIKKITEVKATEQLEGILGTNKKKEAA